MEPTYNNLRDRRLTRHPETVFTGVFITPQIRNMASKKPGLYANIQAKRKRIAHGSDETMRKPGEEGAPSKEDFKKAAKTEKKPAAKKKAAAKKSSSK